MDPFIVGDRHVGEARIVAQHRRSQAPVLGQVAAQQAVLDIVEGVELAADPEARTLEERLDFAQARRELQLRNVAQDAGIEDVHPKRGLRRNADSLRIERREVAEARGEPPALPRGRESGVVARGAIGVEMCGLHRLQHFRQLPVRVRHVFLSQYNTCKGMKGAAIRQL